MPLPTNLDIVVIYALALDPKERARLAMLLIDSLDVELAEDCVRSMIDGDPYIVERVEARTVRPGDLIRYECLVESVVQADPGDSFVTIRFKDGNYVVIEADRYVYMDKDPEASK